MRVSGRICGLDTTPTPDGNPFEWLRGRCVVTIAVDPADIPTLLEVFRAGDAGTLTIMWEQSP